MLSPFGSFSALRNKPIPDLTEKRKMKNAYKKILIDVSDERSTQPLQNCALNISGKNYYYYAPNPPYHRRIPGSISGLFLRPEVITKLSAINRELRMQGLEFYLFDAFRPDEVQAYFHDYWFPDYIAELHPNWNQKQIKDEVSKYWSAPAKASDSDDNSGVTPPHSTGAALDTTLRWYTGEPLFMGTIFDDTSEASRPDHYELVGKDRALTFSEIEARDNRRLLYHLMTDHGFANHPYEWWHFSFGDQLWALMTGGSTAFYGRAILPDSA